MAITERVKHFYHRDTKYRREQYCGGGSAAIWRNGGRSVSATHSHSTLHANNLLETGDLRSALGAIGRIGWIRTTQHARELAQHCRDQPDRLVSGSRKFSLRLDLYLVGFGLVAKDGRKCSRRNGRIMENGRDIHRFQHSDRAVGVGLVQQRPQFHRQVVRRLYLQSYPDLARTRAAKHLLAGADAGVTAYRNANAPIIGGVFRCLGTGLGVHRLRLPRRGFASHSRRSAYFPGFREFLIREHLRETRNLLQPQYLIRLHA